MKRFTLLFCLIWAVSLILIYSGKSEKELAIHTVSGERQIDKSARTKSSKSKALYILEAKRWLSFERLVQLLKLSKKRSGFVTYGMKGAEDFTASAPGIDRKHHIVNSYLVGYSPFKTKNIWIPWQTLARKKTYQLDYLTYKGREEVWQSSRQAYHYTRGDCEDHAIALADWLINMGEDARVVIGRHKGEGHAWVVLLKNGKEYLLEATQKAGIKKMRKFPLAKHKSGYQPEYMFNRLYFWKNSGSITTTKYSSSQWIKKSRYTAQSSI